MGDRDSTNDSIYCLRSREDKIKQQINDDPAVYLVDSLLHKAIEVGASDIHLEPTTESMRVRYRIDGILYDQEPIDLADSSSVLSRLKVLSSIDIAQKRVPQDGKFRVKIDKKNNLIDLRVSTFPSIYGEKMVIRILDKAQNFKELEGLGFNQDALVKLYGLIKRPYGFFLVTGPTGSGKTTTLYSVLSKLNDAQRNIVTMEDPVEYNLDGITQSQINPKAGFTFDKGLRSILRQDPDVIMVGEIRDKQTAQTAIEAALTGHLVFSTLHTNDAASAVTRLIEMGIEPFLISASLVGVLAQRLVRKLCNKCKQQIALTLQEQEVLGKEKLQKAYRPKGCKSCFNLGYKGRTGIFELLVVDDLIRELILNRLSVDAIRLKSVENGLKTMLDDGILKVKDGAVSVDELLGKVKN